MANYEDKMTKLTALVSDYNSQADENKVDFDKVTANLKKAGVFNDATLSSLIESDFVEAGLPKILARRAVAIISQKEAVEGNAKPYISEKKAAQLTVQQLVEAYDPRDSDSAVAKRLSEISKNQPCIVYSDETLAIIAVAESVASVNLIRDGYPAREFVILNNSPTACFKVGQRPFDMADENPMYVGVALLPPDQTCTLTNRSWSKAPLRLKQLVRLACVSGELRNTTENAHNLLDLISESESPEKLFDRWAVRYPRAALAFKDQEKQGTLPTLRIPRKNAAPTGGDPFFTHRRS